MSIYYLDRPDFAPIVLNYPGRPVYSGNALALEAVSDWTTVPSGSTESLLTIYGTGRLTSMLVHFVGSFAWPDLPYVKTMLYLDGAHRATLSLYDFEHYIVYSLYNKAYGSGADGWYYPDILHPVISPVGAKWNATNKVFEEYVAYLNVVIEFVESLEIKVKNELSSDIKVAVRAIAGYYP